ncbi:extracellular solute-binding protein [Janibacter terrae]|uniref:Extracellular solute-binding protein n=1 Tax=Janibacter terrae TaxID=103817 RepID=A0ABZ2FGF1_9MICO|nr:extracellular solute-binding protein [Janibacter terrae]MBA4085296.1 ABC transporter substrate-binding protein [Kytococcus sp.]HBO53790.1 ABC transporter substrate-binding protein [Janibacter terrae]
MTRRRRRIAFMAAAATAASLGLAACGDDSSGGGTAHLTWYINPDGGGSDPAGGGQAQLAKECSDASDGAYTIGVQLLPNSASDQRQQLLRRLASQDKGVDLMSIDPVFVAEFAEAGFLAPVPQDKKEEFTGDAVDPSVTNATWKDELYAAPFWANTQLLWYRKSVAKKAGLDMTKPVTWDQVIKAAKETDSEIGVQASRYEGYMVWINALVEGGGDHIVENPGADGGQLKFGLESEGGKKAAEIIRSVSSEGVGGPALSSTNETTTLDMFQNEQAGFMVNWPYVYAALSGAKVDWMKDLAWARYPQTVEGTESKPPLGGIEMAVASSSEKQEQAWDAVECLTSEESQKKYMVGTGNPAARKAVYDDPEVKKAFPMAALIRQSLDSSGPRPLTQYYGDVSSGIQREYSPPGSVDPGSTPQQTTTLLQDVLKGDALL